MHNLEQALTNPGVPPDVVNMILNLAEFMEHDDKALAIESRLLGDYVNPLLPSPASFAEMAYRPPLSTLTQRLFITRRWNSSSSPPNRLSKT